MSNERTISIIIHSGEYDRVHHALSIGLTALAFGGKARILFTYWALDYIRKDAPEDVLVPNSGTPHGRIIEKRLREGHLPSVRSLIGDARELGCEMYACVSSMALLNVSRDELLDAVTGSTGIASFLRNSRDGELLYV